MNDFSVLSSMEAAYVLEMQSNPALRALSQIISPETLKQIWQLGYAKGSLDAFNRCHEMVGQPHA